MTIRAGLISALLVLPMAAQAESLSGTYLSAVQAEMRSDHDAAALYYQSALAADPSNKVLMQRALGALISDGKVEQAVPIARTLLAAEPANQLPALILLADAFRNGQFEEAKKLLSNEAFGFNPLLSGLMKGWAEVGIGDVSEAERVFDGVQGNETLVQFGRYHKALMYASAGDFQHADELLAGTDGTDPIRLNAGAALAHVQVLSQLERKDDALALITEARSAGFGSPGLDQAAHDLAAGKTLPFTVIRSPADGAADAVLVLADALSQEAADTYSLLYARLAGYIRPGFDDALLLSAAILEQQGQFDLATAAYAEIPADSVNHVMAEIGRADALQAAGKQDAAVEVLTALTTAAPDSVAVWSALGDTYRAVEDYADAEPAYSSAIDLTAAEGIPQWPLYYARAITRERQDKWPAAEADFREALKLSPDQPLVLNYLGYSMVEKRQNLEEAQAMIEKAVKAQPEDGYITDSLGWVLYRVGKYDEAVQPMERAVELKPVDPIINDHLGDVLWMVGRKREAEFQWKRALSFEPEEKDAGRIRRKLEVGLDTVLAEEAANPDQAANGG